MRAAAMLAVFVAVAAAALALKQRWTTAGLGTVREFVRKNRPIFFVFGGTALVLAIGGAAGSSGDAVVILHVIAWYVFTIRQLARAPRAEGTTSLRSSLAAFNVLHIASAVLLLLVGAYWAFMMNNESSVSALNLVLSRESFRYWTILHVSVSWAGR